MRILSGLLGNVVLPVSIAARRVLVVGPSGSNPGFAFMQRGNPGCPLGLFPQLQNGVSNHCLPPTAVVIIPRDGRGEDTGLENTKGE